jgi:hypothetical protein
MQHTPSLQVAESILSIRFPSNVEIHWSTWLVVGVIEEVSLLECGVCMRGVSWVIGEMINLKDTIRLREMTNTWARRTGMSIVYGLYANVALRETETSFRCEAPCFVNIEALAEPARPAITPVSSVIHFIFEEVEWRRKRDDEERTSHR